MLSKIFLASLVLLVVGTSLPFASAYTAHYNLQASKYGMGLDATLEQKQDMCITNFGSDASLVDLKTVVDGCFEGDTSAFNTAINNVFLMKPNSALFAMYAGTDKPTGIPNAVYVVSLQQKKGSILQVGKAYLYASKDTSQVLCVVPTPMDDDDQKDGGGSGPKPYQAPEDKKNSNNTFAGSIKFVLLAGFVGMVVIGYRKVQENYPGFLSNYSLLPSNNNIRSYHHHHSDIDASTPLSTELSHMQGQVMMAQGGF